ncbi:MAG: cysteine methyltransferase [Acidobacteria bacterium]|nr:MAG: cysteine methyltransferase [Acidobacteriota bacterium]
MLRDLLRPVWKIPKGNVATYGSVARAAGFPRNARQVAWALRAAHGAIPWHRVVGAGGEIKLPGAPGMEQKLRLMQEGVTFRGRRIRMSVHEFQFGRGKK